MLQKPNIFVFSDGTSDGGGFEFEKFVEAFHSYNTSLNGNIVGVTSSHSAGGVRKRAGRHEIDFVHFPGPWTAEGYQSIALASGAEFFVFVDWLKPVRGTDIKTVFSPETTFIVHPGIYPEFHGLGFYGKNVYTEILRDYRCGEITNSEVIFHFVTDKFDEKSIFSRIKVIIEKGDDPLSLEKKTRDKISRYLPMLVNMVVNRRIRWDDVESQLITLPFGYSIEI